VISGSSIEERLDHAMIAIATLFDSRRAPGPSGISWDRATAGAVCTSEKEDLLALFDPSAY